LSDLKINQLNINDVQHKFEILLLKAGHPVYSFLSHILFFFNLPPGAPADLEVEARTEGVR